MEILPQQIGQKLPKKACQKSHKFAKRTAKNSQILFPFRFGSMPDRVFVLRDGVVEYAGRRGPFGDHLGDLERWMDKQQA